MKTLKITLLLVAAFMLCPTQALARGGVCTPRVAAIEDSDLTSSRSFTATRNTRHSHMGWLKVRVNHNDSANGTVTRVDMTCVEVDRDSVEFILQDCSISSGVCTSSDVDWQKTVSGSEDKKWVWRVDVSALKSVKCTFDAGAGTGHADDAFDVDYQYCQ